MIASINFFAYKRTYLCLLADQCSQELACTSAKKNLWPWSSSPPFWSSPSAGLALPLTKRHKPSAELFTTLMLIRPRPTATHSASSTVSSTERYLKGLILQIHLLILSQLHLTAVIGSQHERGSSLSSGLRGSVPAWSLRPAIEQPWPHWHQRRLCLSQPSCQRLRHCLHSKLKRPTHCKFNFKF